MRRLLSLVYTFSIFSIAHAQSGSEVLSIHFEAPIQSYGFTTTVLIPHSGTSFSGTYHSGQEQLSLDTSLPIQVSDSIHISFENYLLNVIIDSSFNLIKTLSLEDTGIGGGTIGYDDQAGGGLWRYYAVVDSVSFIKDSSSLIISTIPVPAMYYTYAFWGSVNYEDDEQGSESSSGFQIDTLSLKISTLNSLVSSLKTSGSQKLSVALDNEGFYEATFNPTPTERELDVMNLLGSKVISLPIYSESSSIRLLTGIHPGFYFARLGNEIAKFVVTQ